jgi:hypothetical protein
MREEAAPIGRRLRPRSAAAGAAVLRRHLASSWASGLASICLTPPSETSEDMCMDAVAGRRLRDWSRPTQPQHGLVLRASHSTRWCSGPATAQLLEIPTQQRHSRRLRPGASARRIEATPPKRGRLNCPGLTESTLPIVCHVARASMTPASPATLTQPTHDLAPRSVRADEQHGPDSSGRPIPNSTPRSISHG